MQFTKFTDYSLRALMFMAGNPERLSTVKEISEYYNISQNHMVKVVHSLSKLGYIESIKGKGGGIKLLKSPEKINLRKLVFDIEPNFNLVECFDKEKNTCSITKACGLKGIFKKSLDSFMTELGKYTLDDAIRGNKMFINFDKGKGGIK